MSDQLYLQAFFGTAVLELCGLFVLVFALWWMRMNIRRVQSGAGGPAQAWIAGVLALFTGIGMVALALVSTLVVPNALRSMELIEAAKEDQAAFIGQPAPELRFRDVTDDRRHDLGAFHGDVVLVNFWATWCHPCLVEMPDLERLQADLRPRGLIVLHLSDESRETIDRYLRKQRFANLHVYARNSQWPAVALPTTYVVDRQGVVLDVHVGVAGYDRFAGMVEPYL